MTVVLVGLAAAVLVFAGALIGLHLHRFLPAHHLTKETQEVGRLGTGTLSVLASLVLGLLIATANSSSETINREFQSYTADLILLDGILRDYGPDAAAPRALLRRHTMRTLQDVWPKPGDAFVGLDEAPAIALLRQVRQAILVLIPTDVGQRWLQEQALQTVTTLLRQRWLMIEQARPSVHPIILGVVVTWIIAIFLSFGLGAPRNATTVAAFLVCSLAIGGAIFLILELDSPLAGLLRVSDQPMLNALAHINSE